MVFSNKRAWFGQSGKSDSTEKKLYDRIWTRWSVLSQFRKKYMTKNVKEVCQFDGNPLIQCLSSSLNPDSSRFLASIFSNTRQITRY
jgi:hypothetical protein